MNPELDQFEFGTKNMHISEIPPSRPSPLLRAGKIATHHEESFFPSFLKVSIDHLFDNLESGKRNYCFGKKSGKILKFWIQKSVRALY